MRHPNGQDWALHYIVTGDCNGKNRDTRNNRSDYDIVKSYLDRLGVIHESMVPASNPSLRKRHVRTNSYCRSADGRIRLLFWQSTKKADEGMRLVRLRKGADYAEDDSKDYQHVTTAIGYAIMATIARLQSKPQGTSYG